MGRMRKACALLSCIVLASALFAQEAFADARADLATAIEARDKNHDAKTARTLLTPLALLPRDTAESRDVAARASFLLAELDETERNYPSALAHYRDVLAIDPGNWYAVSARARIDALAIYDGGYALLARLDAVRKDPQKANDGFAIDALHKEAIQFPAGRVRNEALLFVAEAYVGRLHRPADAVTPALAVAKDEHGDAVHRSAGYELAYSAMHAIGDLDRERRELGSDPQAPDSVRSRVKRDVRRHSLHATSIAIASTGLALFVWALVRTLRRGRWSIASQTAFDLRAIGFLAILVFGGYLLGEKWEAGQGAHFLPFGIALVLVHLLVACWRGAYGDESAFRRAIGSLTAAACVLAAAYLVLERGEAKGTPLLQGFGL